MAVAGICVFSVAHGQTFFSPSQTDLLNFTFADYWPGNGAALTNVSPVGADGVQYTFNTGFSSPTPDNFSRSQWNLPFSQDLTGYNNIGVAFQIPAGGSVNGHPMFAQIGLHYVGGEAVSNWVAINAASRTNIYMPLSVIPPSALSQLTTFDIELRSDDPFETDIGDRVHAFVAPAPPEYEDGYQINDFEPGEVGTWVNSFQPDHATSIVTADGSEYNNGVTKGNRAMQIVRTYTGNGFPDGSTNTSFRWGSQMQITAGTGGGPVQGDYNNNGTVDAADYTRWRNTNGTAATLPNDPTPGVDQGDYTRWKQNFGMTGSGSDPGAQRISEIVDAINEAADNGGRIAFDLSVTNPDQFPGTNPGFFGLEMFISDGDGTFFQPDTTLIGQVAGQGFGFPPLPAVDSFSKGVTLSLPLNIFRDLDGDTNRGLLGAYNLPKTNSLTIGLASNTDGNLTFSIDNIRILNLVENPGLGAGSAVPEPTSLALAFVAFAAIAGGRRRS
jgi:hypothetical protein